MSPRAEVFDAEMAGLAWAARDATAFLKEHPEHIADNNAMDFVSEDGGETYNKCHFV